MAVGKNCRGHLTSSRTIELIGVAPQINVCGVFYCSDCLLPLNLKNQIPIKSNPVTPATFQASNHKRFGSRKLPNLTSMKSEIPKRISIILETNVIFL